MNEVQGKKLVRTIIEHLGVKVRDVVRKDKSKTPDFEFIIEDEHSLVEFKIRDGSWKLLPNEQAVLNSGDVLTQTESTGYKNGISSIIRHACNQLREYQADSHQFRLLWFHTFGEFAELSRDRVKATLLAHQNVFDVWNPKRQWMAYYFGYCEFLSQADVLDGAFLTCIDKDNELSAQLCLNTFSPRYMAFRASRLCKAFAAGIFDPSVFEQRGQALHVDRDVLRSDPHSMLKHLSAKYSLNHLWFIPMQQHTFSVQVPHEP